MDIHLCSPFEEIIMFKNRHGAFSPKDTNNKGRCDSIFLTPMWCRALLAITAKVFVMSLRGAL
jgi:hypothetical protein